MRDRQRLSRDRDAHRRKGRRAERVLERRAARVRPRWVGVGTAAQALPRHPHAVGIVDEVAAPALAALPAVVPVACLRVDPVEPRLQQRLASEAHVEAPGRVRPKADHEAVGDAALVDEHIGGSVRLPHKADAQPLAACAAPAQQLERERQVGGGRSRVRQRRRKHQGAGGGKLRGRREAHDAFAADATIIAGTTSTSTSIGTSGSHHGRRARCCGSIGQYCAAHQFAHGQCVVRSKSGGGSRMHRGRCGAIPAVAIGARPQLATARIRAVGEEAMLQMEACADAKDAVRLLALRRPRGDGDDASASCGSAGSQGLVGVRRAGER